jgi:hypothetical protein
VTELSDDKPTKESVLGTLGHRAVLMPFTKPKTLRRGKLKDRGPASNWETVEEAICCAVKLLLAALAAPNANWAGASQPDWWGPGHLVADAAGPWWDKALADFVGLTSEDKAWVLAHLDPAVRRAASWLHGQSKAQPMTWRWAWSEVPLATWGGDRPSIARPDLLVRTAGPGTDGLVIDLKFTAKQEVSEAIKGQMGRWRSGLASIGFPEDGRFAVLFVDPDGNREPVFKFVER